LIRRARWALTLALSIGVGLAVPMSAAAVAPVSFEAAKTYPAELPSAIAVGQLTPGGRSFVVVADGDSEDVSVFLAEPNGSLVSAGNHDIGGHPLALAIGDLTGDGDSDIVASVAGSGSTNIATLIGDGTGNFPTLKTSPIPGADVPVSIALGDFNGDNKLDLVTADGTEGKIALALGNGDGTFDTAKAKLYSASSEPQSDIGTVKVADFNHDGKLGVATSTEGCGYENGDGEVRVFLGNGDGTLKTPPSADVLDTCATRMSVADLTGKGIPDIVTNNYEQAGGGGYLASMLGKGDGTFGTLSLSPTTLDGTSLTLPDLNGDGLADAAIGAYNPSHGPEVQVLTGNGDGTFNAPQSFPLGAGSEDYVSGITYGDLNHDGKNDLVVAYDQPDTTSGGIAVLLNKTGTSPPTTPTPTSTSTPTPTQPTSPSVQLCSLVGTNTPAGAALQKLKSTSRQLIHKTINKPNFAFELFLTAGFERLEVCQANMTLLTVLPFTATTSHAIFETSPTPTAAERKFWYEPGYGWQYNKGAPDWSATPPSGQFEIKWSYVSPNIPKTPIDVKLHEGQLTFALSPLADFRGPLVETELVREGTPTTPISLAAKVKPHAFVGANLSLALPEAYCYSLTEQNKPFPFLPPTGGYLEFTLEHETEQQLVPAFQAILKRISTLVATARQVSEAIETIAEAYENACNDGEELAENGDVLPGVPGVDDPALPIEIPPDNIIPLNTGLGGIEPVITTVEEVAGAVAASTTAPVEEAESEVGPPSGPMISTTHLLPTRRGRLNAARLRPLPLPRHLAQAVSAVVPWRVKASVGRLLLGGKLAPGHSIDIATARLTPSKPHYAELVLIGPGYSGARFVRVRQGLAAADVQLPKHMTPGPWTIAILDYSRLRLSPHRIGSGAQVRIATFNVAAVHKRHRH
jgi:hypothetical protein